MRLILRPIPAARPRIDLCTKNPPPPPRVINPCISIWFFSIIFVAGKSDFVLTEFCMAICKDVWLTEPCNLWPVVLHWQQWMFLWSPKHFTFLRYNVLSSQQRYTFHVYKWLPKQGCLVKLENYVKDPDVLCAPRYCFSPKTHVALHSLNKKKNETEEMHCGRFTYLLRT